MDQPQHSVLWKTAPDWAKFHVYQSWGEGVWSDQEPNLGAFFHNRGRWWHPQGSKTKGSGLTLPLGMDYRVTLERRPMSDRPKIVCLCGSTRFSEAYQQANLEETLAGRIVLTIGCDMRSDADIFKQMSQEELIETKQKLDALHLWKVSLADEVLVISEGGYFGESTTREIEYAHELGKVIRWMEDEAKEKWNALA